MLEGYGALFLVCVLANLYKTPAVLNTVVYMLIHQ